ncbi:related to transcription factor HAP3 [Rhynchosporium graminicola]|uniref:Related to transcription factor HAP3 n=1 Tax=Rhynchosporium graminicola TaxID=2792576 RepID=A0A1E1KXS3_9HELO|nr:related to transcription factor HAP3 [Rhynchosporium commune]
MSASPKETDHEAGVQSPDDPDAAMNDPHNSLQFEFEKSPHLKPGRDWHRLLDRRIVAIGRRGSTDWPVIELEVKRFLYVGWSYYCHTPIMSHDSSSQSPEAAQTSKTPKQDSSDSNIRNFAPVARIMKTALPDNAKIAKEAKECMQECVSEFISFITSEASEKCHQEKRKTVNGEDILFAMTSLGFENYAEALKIYLAKYRETQSTRGEQRPGSQGGFGSAAPGGVGTQNAAPTNFQSSAEGSNNILQQADGEHDPSSYGNIYDGQVSSGHNGATGGGY